MTSQVHALYYYLRYKIIACLIYFSQMIIRAVLWAGIKRSERPTMRNKT